MRICLFAKVLLGNGCICLLIKNLLLSIGCCLFHGRYLVMDLHATISRSITCIFMVAEIIYSTLKMEAAGSSILLVPVYQVTWCHIPEDHNLLQVMEPRATQSENMGQGT
jgi:hypothetical protein